MCIRDSPHTGQVNSNALPPFAPYKTKHSPRSTDAVSLVQTIALYIFFNILHNVAHSFYVFHLIIRDFNVKLFFK